MTQVRRHTKYSRQGTYYGAITALTNHNTYCRHYRGARYRHILRPPRRRRSSQRLKASGPLDDF
jgi:hypothetical protein